MEVDYFNEILVPVIGGLGIFLLGLEFMATGIQALSVNKITRILEKAFLQASAYQAGQRMGFLRRSLFANAFQWALKEQAYPQDFVVMATEGLLMAISAKPAPKTVAAARGPAR